MKSARILAVAIGTLALLAPAAANAAVVDLLPEQIVFPEDLTPTDYYTARYVAGARDDGLPEVNRLRITFDHAGDGGRVTFHDPGAKVKARLGCAQVDVHTVRCTGSDERRLAEAEAYLGYGDDSLDSTSPVTFPQLPVTAYGGPGKDVLKGGPEGDDFDGGGGRDRLLGGRGGDLLNDGDRDGHIVGGVDSDVLDGGPDHDTISYRGRKRSVTVDLTTNARPGERGEKDNARGFESAEGGGGDDRLVGDNGINTLSGGAGDDVLFGRGGEDRHLGNADTLYGGRGRDKLNGGPGGDYLAPGPGRDFRISCDGGSDYVAQPQAGEEIGHCERIAFSDDDPNDDIETLEMSPHPAKVAPRHVDFDIPCPPDGDGVSVRCGARVELRKAFGRHRLLGTASFSRNFGEGRLVKIRLTRLGRRLIRRSRGVVATVYVRGNYPIKGVAWTVRIRR